MDLGLRNQVVVVTGASRGIGRATALGFHVINLVETKPPTPRPLEDVKPQVEELVYQEHATEFYRQWIRQLRSRSHIDVKL